MLGLRVAPSRSLLVPTAHDEPAIQLKIYRDMFTLPAGIAYNTAVERQFLKSNFTIRAASEEIVGCGVDLPQLQGYQTRLQRQRHPQTFLKIRTEKLNRVSAASIGRKHDKLATRLFVDVTGYTVLSYCTVVVSTLGKVVKN